MVDRLGPPEWRAAAAHLTGEKRAPDDVVDAVADYLRMLANHDYEVHDAGDGEPDLLELEARRARLN